MTAAAAPTMRRHAATAAPNVTSSAATVPARRPKGAAAHRQGQRVDQVDERRLVIPEREVRDGPSRTNLPASAKNAASMFEFGADTAGTSGPASATATTGLSRRPTASRGEHDPLEGRDRTNARPDLLAPRVGTSGVVPRRPSASQRTEREPAPVPTRRRCVRRLIMSPLDERLAVTPLKGGRNHPPNASPIADRVVRSPILGIDLCHGRQKEPGIGVTVDGISRL